MNYLGDEDVFLFQVEAGAIYEIEVTLGTLADSDLVVYDEPDEWKGRFYSPVLSVKTHRNVWRSEYTGRQLPRRWGSPGTSQVHTP